MSSNEKETQPATETAEDAKNDEKPGEKDKSETIPGEMDALNTENIEESAEDCNVKQQVLGEINDPNSRYTTPQWYIWVFKKIIFNIKFLRFIKCSLKAL